MLRSIDAGMGAGPEARADRGWLKASCDRPAHLHDALVAHASEASSSPVKSRPGVVYNLYHDLVVRHLHSGRVCFGWHQRDMGWMTLTFDELHRRCGALERQWLAAGLVAGHKIALVLPCDVTFVVALLTSLRMGLVASLLPPRGATFLDNRLKQLAPDAVATHPHIETLLGSWVTITVPMSGAALGSAGSGSAASDVRSHTCAPGDVVLQLFSPLGNAPDRPLSLTADQCFAGVLRDAVLVLALASDDRVAIPGFEALQHQPAFLLASLFAGAAFIETDEVRLADAPPPRALGPSVIGVTDVLREEVLQGKVSAERWRTWFVNPATREDWDQWDKLSRMLVHLPRCRHMLLLSNAAFGGSILFSSRHPTRSPLAVLPAPGQAWALVDVAMPEQPAQGDFGLYAGAAAQADPDAWGRFVLSRGRGELYFGGAVPPGFHGQTYPADEVVRLVESHPDVEAASVVLLPTQDVNATRLTLILFAEPSPTDPHKFPRVVRQIESLIARELGPRCVPSQTRAFPLVPRRREDGSVDRDWCKWQFQSGALDRKSRDHIFMTLHALRRALGRAARDRAPSAEP